MFAAVTSENADLNSLPRELKEFSPTLLTELLTNLRASSSEIRKRYAQTFVLMVLFELTFQGAIQEVSFLGINVQRLDLIQIALPPIGAYLCYRAVLLSAQMSLYKEILEGVMVYLYPGVVDAGLIHALVPDIDHAFLVGRLGERIRKAPSLVSFIVSLVKLIHVVTVFLPLFFFIGYAFWRLEELSVNQIWFNVSWLLTAIFFFVSFTVFAFTPHYSEAPSQGEGRST